MDGGSEGFARSQILPLRVTGRSANTRRDTSDRRRNRQRYSKVAEAIQQPGGFKAVQLRVAENYLTEFGKLAQTGNTLILPATLSDVGSMISLAMNVIKQQGVQGPPANPKPTVVTRSIQTSACMSRGPSCARC